MKERSPKTHPHIWIVTPVFNAAAVLDEYFQGISQTDYPKKLISVVMPDGGSTDKTLIIAKSHNAIILTNELKTAEAGKAVGVKWVIEKLIKEKQDLSQNLICLLDSDNFIIEQEWFSRLVEPFIDDPVVVGAEPWEYTWRPTDGYVTRYTSLTSINDPVALFLGNYDRHNILSGKWTELPIVTKDMGNYLVWTVNPKVVPTVGANGAMFRASFFRDAKIGDFLFDIDVLYEYTLTSVARYAKVKIGIVHIYCRTIHDFIRKQRRRIQDYQYFQAKGLRTYPWSSLNKKGLLKFILYTVLVFPLFGQAIIGYTKKPDTAWFFHPVACWITLWIYGLQTIRGIFLPPALADRTNWIQR